MIGPANQTSTEKVMAPMIVRAIHIQATTVI